MVHSSRHHFALLGAGDERLRPVADPAAGTENPMDRSGTDEPGERPGQLTVFGKLPSFAAAAIPTVVMTPEAAKRRSRYDSMDIWQVIVSTGVFDYTLRLGLAALMGGIIGLDREAKDRPAGLRTHMMTAMAASIFTVLTLDLYATFAAQNHGSNADPIRIIEAVTAGVAFLAAGAIIQARGQVKGLTTGAGMWLAGALGVACGTENYLVALVGLLLATVILVAIRPLETHFSRGKDRSSAYGEDR